MRALGGSAPDPEGKKGHTGQHFSCSRIKHQMLRTSREHVKRRGNKDERGKKHALGTSPLRSSGESERRALRWGKFVPPAPRSWLRGEEEEREVRLRACGREDD
eukprot:bmy_00852T0